jgi:hypothetical protein
MLKGGTGRRREIEPADGAVNQAFRIRGSSFHVHVRTARHGSIDWKVGFAREAFRFAPVHSLLDPAATHGGPFGQCVDW